VTRAVWLTSNAHGLILAGVANPDPSDNLSRLGARARFEPDAARAELVEHFVAHGGVAQRVAADLGLTYQGLTRIVRKLGAWDAIDRACEAAGCPRRGGPPHAAAAPAGAPKRAGVKRKPAKRRKSTRA
jgi:hypothetical protein